MGRAILITLGLTLVVIGICQHTNRQIEDKIPDGVGACVWHAAQEAAEHEHADILLVKYKGLQIGHAYCIFEDQGRRFGWDWQGSQPVTHDADAMDLARELDPPLPDLVPESAQLIKVK